MMKLGDLQNRSIQMANISESILRIRKLIAEARKAASKVRQSSFQTSKLNEHWCNTKLYNRVEVLSVSPHHFSYCVHQVSVSMKFNGKSAVQVRTPRSLADPGAYTSLKFHITLPKAARKKRQDANNQFVFYMGNKNVSQSHFSRHV